MLIRTDQELSKYFISNYQAVDIPHGTRDFVSKTPTNIQREQKVLRNMKFKLQWRMLKRNN